MTAQARLLGGRYQVGELLGYGGMAEVHRGRDLRLGRDVAIKMLRTDLARDATFQMRFRREAQNAASLNHPAIVAVYDTGEETAPTGETIPFIVMEFVNGRTLKEVLAAEGRLMPRRVMEISADICAALEFSHRHGIIHRDIKPGNVMLTLTGQVKVMDFGIARALASGATTMTQTSAVIGTAQYLSPEQARGEAVDARSDVYAAGCVVFELLCGHPPFVGDSPVSVAYQHVREDPPTPSSINPDITPPIDAIILKALSKNPLNRYQSAGEMRADLLRAATGRPVMATPVMQHDETVPMAPSGGRSAAGGAGGGRPTPPPARVGDGRRRRTPAWVLATLSGLGVLAVIALVAGIVLSNQPKNVTVPTVLDMSQVDAIAELTRAKLQYQVGEEEFTSTCKKGLVTRQDPQPSEEVAEQTPVTIRVCGGAPQVKIPNVVGGRYDFAAQTLTDLKLKVTRKNVENEAPEGIVVKVSPAPGEMVAENTEVIVEVSKGNLKAVPDVVDKTEQEARAELTAAGFQVSVKYRNSTETPGTVLDQSPNANQKRRTGTTITITVAREMQPSHGPSGTPSASPPAGG